MKRRNNKSKKDKKDAGILITNSMNNNTIREKELINFTELKQKVGKHKNASITIFTLIRNRTN